jgi:2-keto-4-pentenoate hydratase/2-oxohepta-3-ene-1,7-dioic acid hydratase in catechol pathway
MKLLTFWQDDALRLGVVTDAGVVDVAAAANGSQVPTTIDAVLQGGADAIAALSSVASGAGSANVLQQDSLTLGPCVPNPGKIICVGLNYRRHAEETNAAIPTSPVLFSKFNNTLAGDKEEVPLPTKVATQYDWEVELGVVIGKTTRDVSEADALSHVAGYFTADDLSVRDLQNRTSQWLLGKTMDKFFPIGPYLVTVDEVPDPQALNLKCWVNGEVRQDSNTADMIFTVAEVISYASQFFTLEAGDVITTGTPEGVAMGRADKPWLKPGDVVDVEIEGLGRLSNKMVEY